MVKRSSASTVSTVTSTVTIYEGQSQSAATYPTVVGVPPEITAVVYATVTLAAAGVTGGANRKFSTANSTITKVCSTHLALTPCSFRTYHLHDAGRQLGLAVERFLCVYAD